MKNLIIGTSIGYNVEALKPFVLSLRKNYKDHVAIVVIDDDAERDDFFAEHNIDVYKIPFDASPVDAICYTRWTLYRDVLRNNYHNVDKIMFCDVRDVVFQANPFDHEMSTDLEFFYETKTLGECECHRHWYVDLNMYGREVYDSFRNKYIICAGTTIGKKTAILDYCDKMISELYKLKSKLNRFITDQPTHQYMIYNNYFNSYKCYHTGNGPIATLNAVRDIKFDENDNMLNDDGSIVAVVHQWDRTTFKDKFYNKAVS